MRKRLLSMLMLCCLALSLLPVTALAEPEEELIEAAPVQRTAVVQDTSAPDEDLFYQYMLQRAREDEGSVSLFSTGDNRAYGRLTDTETKKERTIYNLLLEDIKNVAAGVTDSEGHISTEFVFTAKDLGLGSKNWTSEELLGTAGVSLVDSDYNMTDDAFDAIIDELGLSAAIQALLTDCPYELYWYDKTSGYRYVLGGDIGLDKTSSTSEVYDVLTFSDDTELRIVFYVSPDYYHVVGEYAYPTLVDPGKISGVPAAVDRAKAVVNDASLTGKSDYERLTAYKNWICQNTAYNEEAIASGYSGGYGDPWQLVWVFDDDPSTKVVCEGYAKAFQFLCDLTSDATNGLANFNSDKVQCYSVTGTMTGGTGAGRHMWNIVTMPDGENKVNYLVDVTNVDEGTVGSPDKLFLKGVTMEDSEGNPTGFTANEVPMHYEYDVKGAGTYSMLDQWGAEILTLSETDYMCQLTLDPGNGTLADEEKNMTFDYSKSDGGDFLLPTTIWGANQFDGWWYTSPSGDILVKDLTDTTDNNIRTVLRSENDPLTAALKAKWNCPVTFDPSPGVFNDIMDGSRYVPEGTAIGELPGKEKVSRDGYELEGWYYPSTGETVGSKATAEDLINDAVTLNAHWNCKVILNTNAGGDTVTYADSAESFAAETELLVLEGTDWSDVTLPALARTDYDFLGWFTASEGGTEVPASGPVAPTTLYAHWQLLKYGYQVDFQNCEGATGGVPDPNPKTELSDGSTYDYSLTPYRPTHAEKTFVGWSTVLNDVTTLVTSVFMVNDTRGTTVGPESVYAFWVPMGTENAFMQVTGETTERIDCYFLENKVIAVGSGLTAAPTVLMATYKDGQMLSTQFVDMTDSTEHNVAVMDIAADVANGATTAKLFWLNSSWAPLCTNATLTLSTGA